MTSEINSLRINKVFKIIDLMLPDNTLILLIYWVYNLKLSTLNKILRHKARLVTRSDR